MNVVSALQQELASLEADLRADPRYRKIERIRAVLAEYVGGANASEPKPHSPESPSHRRERARGVDTKSDRVREIIKAILVEKGTAHRSEFLRVLMEKGIMGKEKDPMASLAAYLSDFKNDFRSVGTGEWALAVSTMNGASSTEIEEAPKN